MKIKKVLKIKLGCLCLLGVLFISRVVAQDVSSAYLVVDLSAGAHAVSYPVTELSAPPSEGWTDEYKTTKLVLRKISAGTFTMGSPSGEPGRERDEVQHSVKIGGDYYIGIFEITQKQWELVMGANPVTGSFAGDLKPVAQVSYSDIRGGTQGAGWPVTSDSDETSFIARLRARTGITKIDLPTESEWEYACRAGTTTSLNSGRDITVLTGVCPNLNELGFYWGNRADINPVTTAMVGTAKPNSWGLYDMHGNVDEWTLDWYGGYPTQASVLDPWGTLTGELRIFRGGSFGNEPSDCRSAYRHAAAADHRDNSTGFRLAIRSEYVDLNGKTDKGVPYLWIAMYPELDESLRNESFGNIDFNAIGDKTAANAQTVTDCYICGLDPTDPDAVFRASIEVVGDKYMISWSPDLNEGGAKNERVYEIDTKIDLSHSWDKVESETDVITAPYQEIMKDGEPMRFFRVRVKLLP